jgi:hypothetical protein
MNFTDDIMSILAPNPVGRWTGFGGTPSLKFKNFIKSKGSISIGTKYY